MTLIFLCDNEAIARHKKRNDFAHCREVKSNRIAIINRFNSEMGPPSKLQPFKSKSFVEEVLVCFKNIGSQAFDVVAILITVRTIISQVVAQKPTYCKDISFISFLFSVITCVTHAERNFDCLGINVNWRLKKVALSMIDYIDLISSMPKPFWAIIYRQPILAFVNWFLSCIGGCGEWIGPCKI